MCVENEHINDDSKIIILNVLPHLNFHHDEYSPKKVSPPVYHNPKIERGTIFQKGIAKETEVTQQTDIMRCHSIHSHI
jgi:hypothetical protein